MSIFSRLRKPASVEPRPGADTAPKGGNSSHPAPTQSSATQSDDEESPWSESRRPPKANGVHAPVARPAAAPPPAPAPKPNGVAHGQSAAGAAAPAAATKRPELGKTMAYSAAYGAGNGVTARAPVERPVVAPPPPRPVHEPAKGSLDLAIEMVLEAEPPDESDASTTSDQVALQQTFEDLAVPYMAEVRSVMMEVRWGEVQTSWLELARPALRSLRKMAEPVGNMWLVEALDRFDAALADVLAPGQPPTPSTGARDALLTAYAPLRDCLPRAFELDGERDRREPLIVRALLEQVPGLDPLMIDKMMGTGFTKLSALYAARADELAAVTGIPDIVAAATAARIQAFRRATPAALASVDVAATLDDLARLLDTLRDQHAAYEDAARGWSDKDSVSKKQLRRERQLSLLQITIELVRLGEVDLAQRLDKLPFAKKIAEIDRMVSQASLSIKTKNRVEARTSAGAAAAT
jgi:hypothetical protein